ncbi:MAG: hypothetical protein ACK40O_02985 [Allosphingosinicella sp.]
MTAAREDRTETMQLDTPRRAWTRPAVERIEAGSAEIGSDVITDVGVTKS